MNWISVFNLNTMLVKAVSIDPQGFIGKHDWIRLTVLNFDLLRNSSKFSFQVTEGSHRIFYCRNLRQCQYDRV